MYIDKLSPDTEIILIKFYSLKLCTVLPSI